MAMSLTERRKKDRERKAEQRAAAKAAGVPTPELTYHAITESLAFAMVHGDKRLWLRGTGWCPVNSAVVFAAAVDLLVDRFQCERDAAKAAVKKALAPRDSWRHGDYTPSANPIPGRVRYRLGAPEQVVVRSRSVDTPVTPTGRFLNSSAEVSGNA